MLFHSFPRSDNENTEMLSPQVGQQTDAVLEQQPDRQDASPTQNLEMMVSLCSLICNPTLLANPNAKPPRPNNRIIGFGQCGIIFKKRHRDYVINVARPGYGDSLWMNFMAHHRVSHAFNHRRDHAMCRIPDVCSYVPKENQSWWECNETSLKHPNCLQLPSMALISQHIPPLSERSHHGLVDRYCPSNLRSAARANSANRDCLARVHLGRRCAAGAPLPPNFTLRNYNLCLDQMQQPNLPVIYYAAAIGEALAIMHWATNVDAYDVEFVLGSEPDDKYTHDVSSALNITAEQVAAMEPHTSVERMLAAQSSRHIRRRWVLDFNLCNMWEEKIGWEAPEGLVAQLVTAFFENDPYYPLLLMDNNLDKRLWTTFSGNTFARQVRFSRRLGRMRDCVICRASSSIPA